MKKHEIWVICALTSPGPLWALFIFIYTSLEICTILLLKTTYCKVKSLTSEATPSANPFFKRAYKTSHPGLICLAMSPRQKFGLILVIKFFKI